MVLISQLSLTFSRSSILSKFRKMVRGLMSNFPFAFVSVNETNEEDYKEVRLRWRAVPWRAVRWFAVRWCAVRWRAVRWHAVRWRAVWWRAVRWRMIIYPHPPLLTQSQVFLNTLAITKVDVAYSMSQTPEEEANDKARERARVAADIKKSAAEKAKLQKKVVF